MNISSINSRSSAMMMKGMQRPDPSNMAEDLFSKLDTKGQGYIEISDLESALSRSHSSNSSSRSNIADKIFSKLDGDGDGKVTKEDMSATVQKISSELDGPSPRMRMQGDMPPPPPPSSSQDVQEASSTDSTTSSPQSSDPADTNSDGTVSAQEGLASEAEQSLSGSSTDGSSLSASSTSSADAKFMKQMMQLLKSYDGFEQTAKNSDFSPSA